MGRMTPGAPIPGVDYQVASAADIRAAMDVHSAFTAEKFFLEGVDAHFNARKYSLTTDYFCKPSDYWKHNGPDFYINGGGIRAPPDIYGVAIYSKGQFNLISAKTRLPPLTKNGQTIWIGFEDGYQGGTGYVAFDLLRSGGLDKLYCHADGAWGAGGQVDVTAALPGNYQTVEHVYTVMVFRGFSEFYIDSTLVCVTINGSNLANVTSTYPPYGVANANAIHASEMTSLIEVECANVDLTLPLDPERCRLSHVDILQPKVYRLYETGTTNKFAGKALAAGTLTSHPVPILGCTGRTFYFQSDTAGTILVQVLPQTGTWRTYETINYAANAFLVYPMIGDAVLARLAYTPTGYPANIAEGEVVLR